jgi:hydrogenase-4 component B
VNGLRRAPTWDCGYAAPDARMQYTGGSFGRTASDWFSWILLPERVMRRPRGPFPPNTVLFERVPETVLERLVSPVAAGVMRLASGARRLQHGRVQFYIVYLVGGITVLAILALLG